MGVIGNSVEGVSAVSFGGYTVALWACERLSDKPKKHLLRRLVSQCIGNMSAGNNWPQPQIQRRPTLCW